MSQISANVDAPAILYLCGREESKNPKIYCQVMNDSDGRFAGFVIATTPKAVRTMGKMFRHLRAYRKPMMLPASHTLLNLVEPLKIRLTDNRSLQKVYNDKEITSQ